MFQSVLLLILLTNHIFVLFAQHFYVCKSVTDLSDVSNKNQSKCEETIKFVEENNKETSSEISSGIM